MIVADVREAESWSVDDRWGVGTARLAVDREGARGLLEEAGLGDVVMVGLGATGRLWAGELWAVEWRGDDCCVLEMRSGPTAGRFIPAIWAEHALEHWRADADLLRQLPVDTGTTRGSILPIPRRRR